PSFMSPQCTSTGADTSPGKVARRPAAWTAARTAGMVRAPICTNTVLESPGDPGETAAAVASTVHNNPGRIGPYTLSFSTRPNPRSERNHPEVGPFNSSSWAGCAASNNTSGFSAVPVNCDRPCASKNDGPLPGNSKRFVNSAPTGPSGAAPGSWNHAIT